MQPSRILRALKSIIWKYPTHHAKDGRRPEAEKLVKAHYEAKKDSRFKNEGDVVAEIKSAFHGGDGKPKEHLTVDFKKAGTGQHVTTHHVYGPRDVKK